MSDSEDAVDTTKQGRSRAKKAPEPRSDRKDSGTDEPKAKRGRGRPKGSSKVTTKKAKKDSGTDEPKAKRGRGRPKGSSKITAKKAEKKRYMDAEAIHYAAEEGDLEMVRHLVEDGVSVDSRDNQNWTPLQSAAAFCRYDVAKFLISCNCELDLKDHENHFTLLHFATVNGWADIAQTVIEKSSESDIVNATTKTGFTPLIMVSNIHKWFGFIWERRAATYENVAALLLRSGADINRSDNRGYTALHYAVSSNLAGIVQQLLKKEGLDLDPQESDGHTPLHMACFRRNGEIIKQLLVAGADANLKNNFFDTPFSSYLKSCAYSPTSHLSLEVINLFVQHGAYFQVSDYKIISKKRFFMENVFNNVELCAKIIINKFSCQTLPALYSSNYYSSMLPSMDNFMLNASQKEEVKNFVRDDIQRNTFCSVLRVHPTALSALCIQCLVLLLPVVSETCRD